MSSGSKYEKKQANERAVFERFARVAGLFTEGAEIESRPEPEPDIVLVRPGAPTIAFELVELVDQEFAATMSRVFSSKEIFDAALESLPSEEQAAFQEAFAHANIFIDFMAGVGNAKRKSLAPGILRALLALPARFVGQTNLDGFEATISYVSVHRGAYNGPLWDFNTVTWIGDPVVESISDKILTHYETPCERIELLAYAEFFPLLPDDILLGRLSDYCSTLGPEVQFAAFHVFDGKVVKFCWNRPDAAAR